MKNKLLIIISIASSLMFAGCTYPAKTTNGNTIINPTTTMPAQTTSTQIETPNEKPTSTSINNECTCPSGYRQDGEACNPECYYSRPACLAPSVPCQKLTTNTKCGIENCHGMDITCGPNPVEMCTEIYMAGDNCRQFASCQNTNGQCQLVESPKFEACKICVEKCKTNNPDNQIEFFQCESQCAK